MIKLYTDQPIPQGLDERIASGELHSLFLAGPSPRVPEVLSWRVEAVQILADLNYEGLVFLPEWSSFDSQVDYATQTAWELFGLKACRRIVFWIPRSETLPGATTNVEFGLWVEDNRSIYGRPDEAPGNEYLDYIYRTRCYRKPYNDLRNLLDDAINNRTKTCNS